jgi:hypothetical protein
MNVLVIDGSRRAKSNTGVISRGLAARLAAGGLTVDLWRVPKWDAAPAELDLALAKLAACDAVVLVAPVYLDELPAVTQRLLESLYERRAELDGHAPLFYAVAHSGFPEPIQRRAELRSMRVFAEQMGWSWQGGVGFGGTSPIDGRPLEEAGMFSKQLRKCLPAVVADVAARRPFSPGTVARCDKSPFPVPLRLVVWVVNAGTRKTVRAGGLDLENRVYGGQASASA